MQLFVSGALFLAGPVVLYIPRLLPNDLQFTPYPTIPILQLFPHQVITKREFIDHLQLFATMPPLSSSNQNNKCCYTARSKLLSAHIPFVYRGPLYMRKLFLMQQKQCTYTPTAPRTYSSSNYRQSLILTSI